jgi:hypothetical protein
LFIIGQFFRGIHAAFGGINHSFIGINELVTLGLATQIVFTFIASCFDGFKGDEAIMGYFRFSYFSVVSKERYASFASLCDWQIMMVSYLSIHNLSLLFMFKKLHITNSIKY